MSQITFNLIVGVILRSVIMMAAGWLVAHGLLPQGNLEEWVAAVVLVVLGVLWSLYQKYVAQRLLTTALNLPPGATVPEVKAIIADGKGPTVAEVLGGGQ